MNDPSSHSSPPLGGAHLAFDLVLLELCELAAVSDSPSLSYVAALFAAMRLLLHDAAGPEAIDRALRCAEEVTLEHMQRSATRASPPAGDDDASLHLRLLGLYLDPLTGALHSAVAPPDKKRLVH